VVTWIFYVQFILSTLVLYTRAYAVWEGSKRIFHLLAVTTAILIVGGSYSVYSYSKGVNSIIILRQNGCMPILSNDDLRIALAILIFSESLAFGLLITKSVMHTRDFGNVTVGVRRIGSRRNILSLMVQDGIGYYACTLGPCTQSLQDQVNNFSPVTRIAWNSNNHGELACPHTCHTRIAYLSLLHARRDTKHFVQQAAFPRSRRRERSFGRDICKPDHIVCACVCEYVGRGRSWRYSYYYMTKFGIEL